MLRCCMVRTAAPTDLLSHFTQHFVDLTSTTDRIRQIMRVLTRRTSSRLACGPPIAAQSRRSAGCRLRHAALLVITVAAISLGCDMPDRHDITLLRRPAVWEIETQRPLSPAPEGQLSSLTKPNAERDWSEHEWQSWYLHHIDPIGYVGSVMMRSQVITDETGGDSHRIKVTLEERQLVHPSTPTDALPSENADRAESETERWPNLVYCLTANEQTFLHDADGNLLNVQCTARRGFNQTSKSITVSNNQIVVDSQGPLGTTTKAIAHTGPLNGPLQVYRTLAGNPLVRKEIRRATVLLPIHDQIASLRLQGNFKALAKRLTPEGIGLDSLNEAIGVITVGEQAHRVRYYWYDDDGLIQTTNIADDPRFTYRCDQSLYEKANEQSRQLSHPIVVEIPGELISTTGSSAKLSGLAFDVEYLSPEIPTTPWFQPAPRQYIQKIGERSKRVVTSANSIPKSRLAGRYESMNAASTQADLAATKLADFRSRALSGVLATIKPLRNLPKDELVQEINRTVHALLSFDPLATGAQPASFISRSTQSDSTEHAIMLVALLRANGIPARMALGLKHSPEESAVESSVESATGVNRFVNRFVNHAWVVAQVDGQWISLDPTTGKPTHPGCLALEINDLSNIDAERMVDHYLSLLRSVHIKIHQVIVAK